MPHPSSGSPSTHGRPANPKLGRLSKRPSPRNRGSAGATAAAGPSTRQPVVAGSRSGRVDANAGAFARIMLLLRDQCRVDFTHYKPGTLRKCLDRRMVLGRYDSIAAYARFLQRTPKELQALFGDFLSGATSFFRNPAAFEALRKKTLPQLFQRRPNEPIRVWAPGCSTGQEAYSIAMLLLEYGDGATGRIPPIQIYGTDLNDTALAKARVGLYPKSQTANLSPERLRKFFVEDDGGFRVNKLLRESCIFARHDLLTDPPFSRMDMISCRNLLIHLEPALQQTILPSFHFALKPDGFLFLGASESIGDFSALFRAVDQPRKIYVRLAGARPPPRHSADSRPAAKTKRPEPRLFGHSGAMPVELSAQREADRVALTHYAPPAVLINDRLQVLQFRGPTGRYLEPAPGKASFNLLQMARDGLMLPLRAGIIQARKANRTVTCRDIPFRQNGTVRTVAIEITPLQELTTACFLVSFRETNDHKFDPTDLPADQKSRDGRDESERPSGNGALGKEARRSVELARELADLRDYVQSLQEQHEASREEIQTASDESQSANEELQSINEELQTSKEELESSNEELITLNDEMVARNADLNQLNSDLNNLHLSINTPILVLDRQLRIRRFTPAAEKNFKLLAADLGQPIDRIQAAINFPELEAFVAEVIKSGASRERDVQDKSGRWYLLRVRPYVTSENAIDGAVFVLIDIDALKQSEQATARALDYSDAILRTARDSLLVLDTELRVTQANDAFYRQFKTTAKSTEGCPLFKLGHRRWDVPKLRTLMSQLVTTNEPFNDFEASAELRGLGRRTFMLHGRRMVGEDQPAFRRFLLSIEDISERLASRGALRQSENRFRRLFEAARDGILLVDPRTRKIVDANPFMTELLGYTHAELMGCELFEIGLVADVAASKAAFRELRQRGYIRYDDLPLKSKRGDRRDVEFVSNLYVEDGVEIVQCNIRDITSRKKTESLLREQEELIFALIEQSPVGTYVVDADLCLLQVNALAQATLGHIRPLIGRNFFEVAHLLWTKPVAIQIVQHFRETLMTGVTYIAPEYSGRRQDAGTEETYDWQIQRITRPDGRHCVVCYFNDITERKRNELKLATQARWADLLSQFTAQLILTSIPGTSLGTIFKRMAAELEIEVFLIYSVSRDGRRMILEHEAGLSTAQRDQLSELRAHEGLAASSADFDEQSSMADVEGNPHPDFEALRAMGAKAYLAHPLRAGSTLFGILLVVSLSRARFDPHEVKFIRTVCDLAAATEERARLLRDTATARDVAQAANQAKDDFLGAVSHELRTPLNPVMLVASERAEDLSLASDVRQDFEIIARNAAMEARLIDDLLDLTRSAHAKLALQLGLVDVHGVLDDAIAIVASDLSHKRIELVVAKNATNAIIQGDRLRLQQVLWNVLRNAAKFTPMDGSVSVTTATSEDRKRLYVSVTDSGIGMTADELGRIFERFVQGDHAKGGASARYGGLGLGLSISRGLVEQHAGTIEASSAGRGHGTTFLIDLPVVATDNAATATTDPVPLVATTQRTPQRRRLLMVEDHDATRLAMENLLSRRGYQVMPAVSVAEARSIAAQQEFDVLVCDIGLPDGTGYELMSELRKLSAIKGIALTGYGSEADIARSLAAGFVSHVTKPVSIQALSQALAGLEVE